MVDVKTLSSYLIGEVRMFEILLLKRQLFKNTKSLEQPFTVIYLQPVHQTLLHFL